MSADPRPAADRGLGQFMSPNACAVAEILIAKGFDARWRFNRDGSPRLTATGRRASGGPAGTRHVKADDDMLSKSPRQHSSK
jgi:hypothetical protein